MYSTKTRFKGQDAFTKTGFLHVGDKYVQKTKGTLLVRISRQILCTLLLTLILLLRRST